jgi:ABC-type sugar transport system permease subunit
VAGFAAFMGGTFAFGIAILGLVVGGFLAIGVYRDATKIESQGSGRTTLLMPPWVWAMAVFLGGVVTAVMYWLLHHGSVKGEFVASLADARTQSSGSGSTPAS